MKPTMTAPRTRPVGRTARRLIALVALLALAVLGLTVTSGPASAVVSGRNGRIVFTRRVCTSTCEFRIVAADSNDTNETVLAGPYPQDAFDEHLIANWSPDGRSVVFMVNQGIWQVNADATGLHELFAAPPDGTGLDDGPAFTPDGSHIVFTRCCPQGFGYSLWKINVDGTGLTHLTTESLAVGRDGPADTEPQVSPDGRLIAFNRCFPDQGCVIATVNINGGNLHQLTDPALDSTHPNWSPDSKRIVFTMQPTVGGVQTEDVAAINPDGTGLTQLTFNPPGKGISFQPCYSPDGTKILFVHGPSTGDRDLFTMSPDGTGTAQVTKTASRENEPEWARVS